MYYSLQLPIERLHEGSAPDPRVSYPINVVKKKCGASNKTKQTVFVELSNNDRGESITPETVYKPFGDYCCVIGSTCHKLGSR